MSRSNKQIPLQKLTVAAKSPLGIGMIVTLAVIAATGGVAAAANSSKPGDSLYSVDTLTEKIQLALTPGSSAKRTLHQHIAEERLQEIQQLFKEKNIDAPGVAVALTNFEKNKQAAINLAKGHDDETEVENKLNDAQSSIDSLFEQQQVALEKARESLKQQAEAAEQTGDTTTAAQLRSQADALDAQLKTLEAKREARKQQQEKLTKALSKESETTDNSNNATEAANEAAKQQQEALQETVKQEIEAQKEAQKQLEEQQNETAKQQQEKQAEAQKKAQEQQREEAQKQQDQGGQD